MNIESIAPMSVTPRSSQSAEQVDRLRQDTRNAPEETAAAGTPKGVQPEELLNQIKALTENGLYSVRFENKDDRGLVIKVVDARTEEVIREIPPEELQQLSKHLSELQGNIVDTVS